MNSKIQAIGLIIRLLKGFGSKDMVRFTIYMDAFFVKSGYLLGIQVK